jgi:FecR-like protein
VRTLADGKVKLLFRDESVLTLGPASTLTVDEQTAGAAPASRFSVLGSLRAVVTERYAKPGARFEVETPTAIAGVRGTGFITRYDASADETTVVGVFDTTLVRAKGDASGAHEVRLGPGEATTVGRGSYPLGPTHVPDDVLRDLSAATTLTGATGAPGGGAGEIEPSAKRPRENAAAPQQIIDQPVGLLNRGARPGGPIAPPPPPAPPPSR